MQALSTDELAAMQETAEGSFFDECYPLRRTSEDNDFGEPEDTWTPEDDPIECGFEPGAPLTRIGSVVAVTEVDAVLRVPIDTDLDLDDRVRISKRHGVAVTAEDFRVFSKPRRGPSALIMDLKRVEL